MLSKTLSESHGVKPIMSAKNKTYYLKYDIIRIVAIFLVLLVHTAAYWVSYSVGTFSADFVTGNIFLGLSRAGVPLFIMLSGALLLNENRKFDTVTFYKKSLLPIVYIFIGWLLVYGAFYGFLLPLMQNKEASWKRFIDYILIFRGTGYPHLWYLMMLIGLYLITPVLRLFVKKENYKYIVGIVIASLIFHFIPTTLDAFVRDAVITPSAYMEKFHMESVGGYIAYYLLGWLLDNFELSKNKRTIWYLLGLLSVLFSVSMVQFFFDDKSISIIGCMYEPTALPPFIFGSAIFLLIVTLCKDKKTSSSSIRLLSDCSFGVYLIHVMVLELYITYIYPVFGVDNHNHPLLFHTVFYIAVAIVSYVLAIVISKCKYVNRIIRTK